VKQGLGRTARQAEPAELSTWDTYKASCEAVPLSLFDSCINGRLGRKRSLSRGLRDGSCANITPPTWASLENVKSDDDESMSAWFLKSSYGTYDNGVHCFDSIEALRSGFRELGFRHCIIQGCPRMPCLLDEYTLNFRIYVQLIWQGSPHQYREGIMPMQWQHYYQRRAYRGAYFEASTRSGDKVRFSSRPHYEVINERVMRSTSRLLSCFNRDFEDRDADRYHLLGLDFLVGANLVPWLLEVNTYPNLHTHAEIRRELFENLFALVIAPRLMGLTP
jgi:hypothetical protein